MTLSIDNINLYEPNYNKVGFIRTTAINKIRALKARKKVIQGGTSSGKTYGIIPILIDRAAKQSRLSITVVAESIPAIKMGALKIFRDVMIDTRRWVDSRYNGTDRIYTFGNGSQIQFTSFDSEGKAKAAGKRDILFINEANHIHYNIADALMIRSKETYIDYNPDNEFWAHTEILKEPNSEFLLLTYKDNEGLPPETLEDILIKVDKAFIDKNKIWNDPNNIKSEYWRNWVKVYVEGEIGSLQGTIFNFNIVNDIPTDAELLGYGMDFGFTNDPTTLVALYKFNKEIYVKELIYERNLRNEQILQRAISAGVNMDYTTYCDDADPKTRSELNYLGWRNCTKANKDHVNASIELVQGFTLNVTADSINLIKELRNYRWAVDKAGKALNEPVDDFNHAIDALRYVAINKLSSGSGEYNISVV